MSSQEHSNGSVSAMNPLVLGVMGQIASALITSGATTLEEVPARSLEIAKDLVSRALAEGPSQVASMTFSIMVKRAVVDPEQILVARVPVVSETGEEHAATVVVSLRMPEEVESALAEFRAGGGEVVGTEVIQ